MHYEYAGYNFYTNSYVYQPMTCGFPSDFITDECAFESNKWQVY